jgi:hypothetical protein
MFNLFFLFIFLGKIYLYKALLAKMRSMNLIALAQIRWGVQQITSCPGELSELERLTRVLTQKIPDLIGVHTDS